VASRAQARDDRGGARQCTSWSRKWIGHSRSRWTGQRSMAESVQPAWAQRGRGLTVTTGPWASDELGFTGNLPKFGEVTWGSDKAGASTELKRRGA